MNELSNPQYEHKLRRLRIRRKLHLLVQLLMFSSYSNFKVDACKYYFYYVECNAFKEIEGWTMKNKKFKNKVSQMLYRPTKGRGIKSSQASSEGLNAMEEELDKRVKRIKKQFKRMVK